MRCAGLRSAVLGPLVGDRARCNRCVRHGLRIALCRRIQQGCGAFSRPRRSCHGLRKYGRHRHDSCRRARSRIPGRPLGPVPNQLLYSWRIRPACRRCLASHSGATMNLTQLFDLSFIGRRNEAALEFSGNIFTFGEIDERSNRMAALFEARGLKRGDRLCVYLANCLEMIDVYLACVKLGVIFVPINILYRERELAHILSDAEPVAVVSATTFPSPAPIWDPVELTQESAAYPNERP